MEPSRRFALGLTAGASFACVAVALAFLVFGEFEGVSWQVLTTVVLVGLYLLLSLPGVRVLVRDRGSVLAWLTVLLAAMGLAWGLRIVWGGLDDSDGSWRLLVTLTACTAAISQVCATTARRKETDPARVGRLYGASNLLAYTLAGLVTLACWDELGPDSAFWKMLGVLALLDVLAVVLQPVLRARERVA